MQRRIGLLLGVLLSAALLAWTLRGMHLEEMARILWGLRIEWLVAGAMFYFIPVLLRTWRWGVLLHGLPPTSFGARFVALTIGYMGNNLYPARAGELLRAYVVQRRSGVRIGAALGTIVVERVFDGWMVLLLGMAALLAFPLPGLLRPAVIGSSLIFGGALAFLIGIAHETERLRTVLERMARRWPGRPGEWLFGFLSRFMDGLQVLREPLRALAVAGLTALIWLAEAGTYGLVLMAFPFRTSFFSLLTMTAAVNLATALPSAPGYIGTFEAPGVAVLRAFGIPGPAAIAYTLVLHLVLWLPITLVGLLLFLREGLRGADRPLPEGSNLPSEAQG